VSELPTAGVAKDGIGSNTMSSLGVGTVIEMSASVASEGNELMKGNSDEGKGADVCLVSIKRFPNGSASGTGTDDGGADEIGGLFGGDL